LTQDDLHARRSRLKRLPRKSKRLWLAIQIRRVDYKEHSTWESSSRKPDKRISLRERGRSAQ
jgi:hypothetical protein